MVPVWMIVHHVLIATATFEFVWVSVTMGTLISAVHDVLLTMSRLYTRVWHVTCTPALLYQ